MNEQSPISASCIRWIPHTASDFKGEMPLTHARRQGQKITMTIKAGDHQCKETFIPHSPGLGCVFLMMREKASTLFWQLILQEQDTRQCALQIVANEVAAVLCVPSFRTDRSILNGTGEMDSQGEGLRLWGHSVGAWCHWWESLAGKFEVPR